MADLKTNYKDDVLDTSKNEKRKFRMIQNDDGTVSFDDATEYTQQGDAFGAADINATNAKINEQNQSLTQLNEEKKLKLLGSANSNTYIDISKFINEYSELLISVTLGNTPYRITINIPMEELVDSDITYQSGSRASASIGTVANVQCSRKRVLLTAVIVNDNDVLAYSTLRIYGRK